MCQSSFYLKLHSSKIQWRSFFNLSKVLQYWHFKQNVISRIWEKGKWDKVWRLMLSSQWAKNTIQASNIICIISYKQLNIIKLFVADDTVHQNSSSAGLSTCIITICLGFLFLGTKQGKCLIIDLFLVLRTFWSGSCCLWHTMFVWTAFLCLRFIWSSSSFKPSSWRQRRRWLFTRTLIICCSSCTVLLRILLVIFSFCKWINQICLKRVAHNHLTTVNSIEEVCDYFLLSWFFKNNTSWFVSIESINHSVAESSNMYVQFNLYKQLSSRNHCFTQTCMFLCSNYWFIHSNVLSLCSLAMKKWLKVEPWHNASKQKGLCSLL